MLNQSRHPPHYGEVCTSASWKTARTVESFDHRISLHKDELSLVNLYKTVLPFKYFALVREVSSYFYFECYAFQLLKIYGPSQWE